jgi:hypothetical protein
MVSSGVGSILENERAIVREIFDAVRDRIDLRNGPDIGVGDRSIENFGDIGTIEIKEIEGDEAKDEGDARDTRDAPKLSVRPKPQT